MKNSRPIRRAALAAVFAAGLFAAPAPAEVAAGEILATVNGEPAVTWYDLYFYYRDAAGPGPMPDVSAQEVEDTVDTLVTADIVVREAERKGYGDEKSFRNDCAGYQRKLLRELLGEALAREEVLTEEEIRSAYEKDTTRRLCSAIPIQKREDAEAAYAELVAGVSWNEVENKYSLTKKIEAGDENRPFILTYDGTAVTEAVYDAPVGGYAGPVTLPFDVAWYIYRVDETVPGRQETFEESRGDVERILVKARTLARMEKLAATLRASSNITRNEEAWRDVNSLTYGAFMEKWANPDVAVSEVDGAEIKGDDFARSISDYFYTGAEGVDAYKAENPEYFRYAVNRLLERMENLALLDSEARRRGIDAEPEFAYRYNKYRGSILTDFFSTHEFKATLPEISDEDVKRYYETHKEEFFVEEYAVAYVLTAADRSEMERARADVALKDKPVNAAAEYAAERALHGLDEGEFYGPVTVPLEPDPAELGDPLVGDIRARVFPFPGADYVSEAFETADGRWAFFVTIRHEPSYQQTFDDPGIAFECSRRAWAEYYGSEEVNELCRRWLSSLRDQYEIELYHDRFAGAAARLNESK